MNLGGHVIEAPLTDAKVREFCTEGKILEKRRDLFLNNFFNIFRGI